MLQTLGARRASSHQLSLMSMSMSHVGMSAACCHGATRKRKCWREIGQHSDYVKRTRDLHAAYARARTRDAHVRTRSHRLESICFNGARHAMLQAAHAPSCSSPI